MRGQYREKQQLMRLFKINKKDLITYCQAALFMLPVGFFTNKLFSIIWYAFLFISIGYFCSKYRLTIKYLTKGKHHRSTVAILLAIYMGTQTLTTFFNHGNWINNLLSLIVVIFMCLFFEYHLIRDSLRVIYIFKAVLLTYILIELILYVIINGTILGTIQCAYIYYIVWATLSIYCSKKEKKKNGELYYITLLFTVVTIIRPQVGDDGINNYEWTFYIIAILFMGFGILQRFIEKIRKIFNGKVIFWTIVALNLIFVIFQIQDRIPVISYLIVNVMNKDISLTGRSYIWAFAETIIIQRPILGYGTGLAALAAEGYWYEFIRIYGPHNQFLYIILAGGVITLIPYLILVYTVFMRLNKRKKSIYSIIFCIGLLGIYLELMVTYRTIANCMPLFVFMTIIINLCSSNYDEN